MMPWLLIEIPNNGESNLFTSNNNDRLTNSRNCKLPSSYTKALSISLAVPDIFGIITKSKRKYVCGWLRCNMLCTRPNNNHKNKISRIYPPVSKPFLIKLVEVTYKILYVTSTFLTFFIQCTICALECTYIRTLLSGTHEDI